MSTKSIGVGLSLSTRTGKPTLVASISWSPVGNIAGLFAKNVIYSSKTSGIGQFLDYPLL